MMRKHIHKHTNTHTHFFACVFVSRIDLGLIHFLSHSFNTANKAMASHVGYKNKNLFKIMNSLNQLTLIGISSLTFLKTIITECMYECM